MRILAIETELAGAAPRFTRALLREEAEAVWAMQKRELIRQIWFADPGRRAVIILECASVDDARRELAALPLVRERCIDFTLLALRAYDGFDRLLAPPRPE